MPVRWRVSQRLVADPYLLIPGDSVLSGRSDQIAVFAARFRALSPQRLIILGEGGTGKTTLAIQLLLELLKSRREGDPVPVLLSLTDWDTTVQPRLSDWLTSRLAEIYPALATDTYGAMAPHALVSQGLILPVLDGLDELPVRLRVGVLSALNSSLSQSDPLILTCRTAEYVRTVAGASDVLSAALAIEPQELTPTDAIDYLTDCIPLPNPSWRRIVEELGAGTSRALASALSKPLGLWLLRAAYPPTGDPAELLDTNRFPDAATIRIHLLAELIPALIRANRPSTDSAELFRPRYSWDAENARRWLSFLARHAENRSFAWWQIAHFTVRPSFFRRFFTLASVLAMALTIGLGAGSVNVFAGGLVSRLQDEVTACLCGGFTIGIGGAIAYWLAFADSASRWLTSDYLRVEEQLRTVMRRQFLTGLGTGITYGIMAGVIVGLARGLTFGLVLGLTAGATFGIASQIVPNLIRSAENRATARNASTADSTWRADRRLTVLSTCTVVVTFSLTFGITVGLAFGLSNILAGGLDPKSCPWALCVMAKAYAAIRGQLPFRLIPFLEDAHRLGLLRAIGPRYQFRHADLQDYLTRSGGIYR